MKRFFAILTFVVLTLSWASAQRLPETARPENYKLTFTPDLENAKIEGDETITIQVLKPTTEITLNAVDIDFHNVSITSGSTQKAKVTPQKDKEMVVLTVEKPLPAGTAKAHITYTGILNSEMPGFISAKTIKAASTQPASSKPPTRAGRILHSTNPITRPPLISRRLRTRDRLLSPTTKSSRTRPVPATSTP